MRGYSSRRPSPCLARWQARGVLHDHAYHNQLVPELVRGQGSIEKGGLQYQQDIPEDQDRGASTQVLPGGRALEATSRA